MNFDLYLLLMIQSEFQCESQSTRGMRQLWWMPRDIQSHIQTLIQSLWFQSVCTCHLHRDTPEVHQNHPVKIIQWILFVMSYLHCKLTFRFVLRCRCSCGWCWWGTRGRTGCWWWCPRWRLSAQERCCQRSRRVCPSHWSPCPGWTRWCSTQSRMADRLDGWCLRREMSSL